MPSIRKQLEEEKAKNKELEAVLAQRDVEHRDEINRLNQEHEDVVTQNDARFTAERVSLISRIEGLEKTVTERDAVIREKQDAINALELKKFAQAFEEQETQFREDAKTWFRYVCGISFVVLLVTGYIIYLTLQNTNAPWHNRVGYYVIDVILITLLVFALKQYSYYVKLSTDYGNRKTLAQSYFNIIDSADSDDDIIKTEFLDKISTILAAPAIVSDEAHTLFEKILDALKDLKDLPAAIKNLKDKP